MTVYFGEIFCRSFLIAFQSFCECVGDVEMGKVIFLKKKFLPNMYSDSDYERYLLSIDIGSRWGTN